MANTKNPYRPFEKMKSSGNLPMIPQILIQLIDICQQDETDLQKAGDLIEKDAALAAKLLQLCNSAFIGARTSFTNVRQATVYLGADTITNLVISVSVQQTFRQLKTNGLLNINSFWFHSYKNAIIARKLAEIISYSKSSEAYLAALVHDIGKLLFWIAFPEKYTPMLLKEFSCHDGQLPFKEQKKFHINHCVAGAWLLKEWGLDNDIIDAVKYHHHLVDEVKKKSPLTRIVFLADLISHSDNPEKVCDEVAKLFFQLEPGRIEKLMEEVDEQIQETAQDLGISISKQSALTKNQETDTENESFPLDDSNKLAEKVKNITQLTGFVDNLFRAKDMNQIAHTMEQSLTIIFNRRKCFLALFNHTTNQLQGYTSRNNPLRKKVQSLTIDIEHYRESLTCRAIELNQILHSFMNLPGENLSPIDIILKNIMGTDGIIIIPLTHKKYKTGILVTGVSGSDYTNLMRQTTGLQTTALQFFARQSAICLYMHNHYQTMAKQLARERLQTAGLLARKIGHDINNPLAIIRNYLKVISLKLKEHNNIQEELAILDEELERIGQVTNQLNNIATETPKPDLELIDINKTIENIIHLYRISSSDNGGVSIIFHPDNNLPTIQTDKNYLGQIIHNLLDNSFDSLCGEGTITVSTALKSCSKRQEHVLIVIHDDGPGIPQHLQKTVFQTGITTKTEGHGGLGLAITARAVMALGGTIDYDSISGSTTFHITIPI